MPGLSLWRALCRSSSSSLLDEQLAPAGRAETPKQSHGDNDNLQKQIETSKSSVSVEISENFKDINDVSAVSVENPLLAELGLNGRAEGETVEGPFAGPHIDRHPFGLGGGGFADLDDFDDPRPEVSKTNAGGWGICGRSPGLISRATTAASGGSLKVKPRNAPDRAPIQNLHSRCADRLYGPRTGCEHSTA